MSIPLSAPARSCALATVLERTRTGATPGRRPAGHWRIAAGAVLAGVWAGPSAAPTGVEQAWAAVEALVGTPRCRSDSDCRTIGIGARACGGPQRYLAWSTQVSDAAALNSAVARHAALQQAANEKAGLSSTCVVVEEPSVHCRRPEGQAWGVCVAAPVTRGPSGNSTQR